MTTHLSYHVTNTSLCPLMLVYSGTGLVRVAFEKENFAIVLVKVAHAMGVDTIDEDMSQNIYAQQLEEYLDGGRHYFDVPLDFSLSSPFQQAVQTQLQAIPYGQTQSYKDVALTVGNPKAVRAVGRACATNPLPLVVPCHRVTSSDGTLGGYLGGIEAKRILLDMEKSAL